MSRLRVLWVSLLGLALVRCTVPSLEDLWREKGFCAAGDEDCGMLRIRVDAQGFEPGCLKFEAKEAGRDATLTATVPYRGTARAGKTLTQGFSPPKDWGLGVTVSVSAFEQGCEGKAVTAQSRQSTLREGGVSEVAFVVAATDADRDGYVSVATGGSDCSDELAEVNPGAAELCNEADDNCNGAKDEGLGLGDTCATELGCMGVKVCGQGGAVTCVAQTEQAAWADDDQDGHGDTSRGQVPVCSSTLPPNRLPLTAPHDDCDDDDARIHPGAVEVCNELDDNCINGTDEGFGIGQACTDPTYQCVNGRVFCGRDGGTQCLPPATVPTWYPDDDQDFFGASDGGVLSCPVPAPGFVNQRGDCDDGNPFIHPNALELCDEQDNNCNNLVDENGACRGDGPTWVSESVNNGGPALRGVSLFGDGGVWVVGDDSTRAIKPSGSSSFTVLPGKCTGGTTQRALYGVWAHPQTGVAYIGGDNDILTIQSPSSSWCDPYKPPSASGTTTSLKGFVGNDGGVLIVGVGSLSNGTVGGSFEWDGGIATVPVQSYSGQPLFGVDGVSQTLLFAVGDASGRSNILRRSGGSGGWVPEASVPDAGALWAVDVVNNKLAYAVGANGTFLAWNGATWSIGYGPVTNDILTGVLAFGSNSVYVVSANGYIFRYNGRAWTQFSVGMSLYDIEGTSPEDIWAVGNFGNVFHYPGWPQ
ncbi:putative metal-binding motif-containing protein [Corallococcus macrosporus]|uniref:Metal-binding motif-containing protein n=1 Tax=Corallococcus macrosporus TaxID=35 RepID=A0ABS3DK50_9BACT|nr:putative metal-binding motif-containing protein [Corallococcus macrosporus]MBN8231702.1 putative metal-binding motif-containing protein [Corallococcus macrosporus]